MSREIKFRAWDKAFDKMINFDDTLAKEWILGLTLWGDVIGCDLKALEPKSSHETYIITYPERFELMQYTGLKDCKRTEKYPEGQEIYEGDIVQYHPEANMGTGPVVYELGAFVSKEILMLYYTTSH